MWTKKGRIRRAEVRTVQRVEGFTARLKREALREPKFAGDCHVNIEVPRCAQTEMAGVTERSRLVLGEHIRIDVLIEQPVRGASVGGYCCEKFEVRDRRPLAEMASVRSRPACPSTPR